MKRFIQLFYVFVLSIGLQQTVQAQCNHTITSQPTNQSVQEFSTATFSVAVSPTGSYFYDWEQQLPNTTQWFSIALNGGSSFTTQPLSIQENGAKFRCQVSDIQGCFVTSSEATLTVTPCTLITTQPTNQTGTVGGSVTFTANASSSSGGTLEYFLQKDMNSIWVDVIPNSATGVLTLNNLSTQDAGQYRYRVSDGVCTEISNVVTLTVNPCSIITSHPMSTSVQVGSMATFAVAATGTNLTYQWETMQPNSNIWLPAGTNGTNTITHTPSSIQEDGLQYRCVITDGNCTETSNPATLTVTPCNLITSQPTDQTVQEGNAVIFSVAATGNNLTYQWEEQHPNNTTWQSINSFSASHTFTPAIGDDGYKYRCIVSDGPNCMEISNTATLTVTPAPCSNTNFITSSPVDVTIPDGATTGFQVITQGTGLTYSWFSQYPGSSAWNIEGAGATSGSSNILSVGPADLTYNGRKYRCFVSDGTCTDSSDIATLSVTPIVPPNPSTVETFLGVPYVTPVTQCMNDTFTIPVYIDAGNNTLGGISLTISYSDSLDIVLDMNNNNRPIHSVHGDLLSNLNTNIQTNYTPGLPGRDVVKIGWFNTNGTTAFATSEIAFELKFIASANLPQGTDPLSTLVVFDTTLSQDNEYTDEFATVLPDDGFTDYDWVYANTTTCYRYSFGNLYYGENPPFTPVYGPAVSIGLKDLNGINVANHTVLDNTGTYSFNNIQPGVYRLELNPQMSNYNAGGINATDALRTALGVLNIFPLTGLQLEAAETDGIPGINANDAYQIARRFTGDITAFIDPMTNNELSSWVQTDPLIDLTLDDVEQDLYTLIRGDVNGSFDPSNLNGGQVSEVTLAMDETIEITAPNQTVAIPFVTTQDLEIGAISMVINFPYDVLKIENVELNEKVNSNAVNYSIKDGRIRLSWFNLSPLSLEAGENLLTIQATTLENLENAWTPTITRGNETELATAMGEVIEDVTLTIPGLVLNLPNAIEEDLAVRTFPNPASDKAVFNIAAKADGQMTIEVYNSLGRLVRVWNAIEIASGESFFETNVSDLPIGQYTVQLSLENENGLTTQVERLVIVR